MRSVLDDDALWLSFFAVSRKIQIPKRRGRRGVRLHQPKAGAICRIFFDQYFGAKIFRRSPCKTVKDGDSVTARFRWEATWIISECRSKSPRAWQI